MASDGSNITYTWKYFSGLISRVRFSCVSEITERYFTPGLFNLEDDIQPELVEIDTYPFPENIHKEGSAESSTSAAFSIELRENCLPSVARNTGFCLFLISVL